MKEYLFLLRGGRPIETKTPEENKAEMAAWGAYMGGLAQGGNLSGGLPLMPGGSVVSASGTVDEPVNAGEGIVGGYLIVKAENKEQAIEFAKGCPIVADEGNVEVRELAPMPAI